MPLFMRFARFALLFVLVAIVALAQTATPAASAADAPPVTTSTQSWYFAAGATYNQNLNAAAVTGLAAVKITPQTSTSPGDYWFGAADLVANSYKPFKTATNVTTGYAKHLVSAAGFDWYMANGVGGSFTSTAVGWAFTTGVLGASQKTWHGFGLAPALRISKSSVSDIAYIGTIALSWGGKGN